MQPAQDLEIGIVHGLHAEGHAVDAGRTVALETLRLDAGRIGLKRDLGPRCDTPVAGDGLENRLDRLRLHQRRGAAAEEDRRHNAPRRKGSAMGQLLAKGRDKARLVDGGRPDVAVEIAIGALRQAEGPVDIDTEARIEGTELARHGGVMAWRGAEVTWGPDAGVRIGHPDCQRLWISADCQG